MQLGPSSFRERKIELQQSRSNNKLLISKEYYYLSTAIKEMATMNAVQVHKFGGPEVLEYSTNVNI